MIYLKHFNFAKEEDEYDFVSDQKMTCFNSYYPFNILPRNQFRRIDCDKPITIFYGGNGSGKSTALNIIAEKIKLQRTSVFNKTSFFENYLEFCNYETENEIEIPIESKIITSDDVFNYMFNVRAMNQEINIERKRLIKEYKQIKAEGIDRFNNGDIKDFDKWNMIMKKNSTPSKYVKKNLMWNVQTHSNGESALQYFFEKIEDGALYLLDEPENSLSPENQIKLSEYIEYAAWACDCQFIIATHSPFLLAMKRSKIYDLNSTPVDIKTWDELPLVKTYKKFFAEH